MISRASQRPPLPDGATLLEGTSQIYRLTQATGPDLAFLHSDVRRDFRKVIDKADLVGADWTPRELRHSLVSLLSDSGMPLEQISRLVGHAWTKCQLINGIRWRLGLALRGGTCPKA